MPNTTTVTAAKIPMPRQLTNEETLETLQHWKVCFKNYWRRDDVYKTFLSSTFTWDPTEVNYGLSAETEDQKRTAPKLKEDLVFFLETLAGFLPHSYITEKIVHNTTCLEDVWNLLGDLYGAELSADSFLDLATMVKQPQESHRQLYERMVDHV